MTTQKYTVVWKKPGTRDPLKEAGPFDMKNALDFIIINQPILVEAIRPERPARLNNEQCNDRACAAIDAGEYGTAMKWFNTARARTTGHTKRDMYEAKAKDCARLGNIEYLPMEYMDQA